MGSQRCQKVQNVLGSLKIEKEAYTTHEVVYIKILKYKRYTLSVFCTQHILYLLLACLAAHSSPYFSSTHILYTYTGT